MHYIYGYFFSSIDTYIYIISSPPTSSPSAASGSSQASGFSYGVSSVYLPGSYGSPQTIGGFTG